MELKKSFQVSKLQGIYGKDVGDTVRRHINTLLTPSVQLLFNRTGRPDPRGDRREAKIAFRNVLEPLIKGEHG